MSPFKPIVDYIDQQFEAYLQEELKVKRNLYNYSDRWLNLIFLSNSNLKLCQSFLINVLSRIHACLYFIAPTGHSLKSLDLVTMKALVEKGENSSNNLGSIILYLLSKLYIIIQLP